MMRTNKGVVAGLVVFALFLFGALIVFESSAWARAGRGGSFGSRGSRSYSTPSRPSSPSPTSPGMSSPGRNPATGAPSQPSGGFFSRSPFMQGLAGGLAGGMLGSLLFGGVGHAAPGAASGGGLGFLDLILIGALLYFGYRFLKKRRAQTVTAGFGGFPGSRETQSYTQPQTHFTGSQPAARAVEDELERGFHQIRQSDPGFNEDVLKETLQDLFFRIQAAWMHRSLDGIEGMVTGEMARYLAGEFEAMKREGTVNRLENIAVRKVEPAEAWQEMGKDFVTVLFTANLLDYTVSDSTGEVVGGDKSNPVKFQEFWTFSRDTGPNPWQLSAINQASESHSGLN